MKVLGKPGAFTGCGKNCGDVESDAHDQPCEQCGDPKVCGCETIAFRLL
jgi:hypothetical protein